MEVCNHDGMEVCDDDCDNDQDRLRPEPNRNIVIFDGKLDTMDTRRGGA